MLGLGCEAGVEGGAAEFRFGLRSDPRTKVFAPSEQIRRPAHCSVPASAQVVGAWVRSPNPEPELSFLLDMNAVPDGRCGGWEASQKLTKHIRVSKCDGHPVSHPSSCSGGDFLGLTWMTISGGLN